MRAGLIFGMHVAGMINNGIGALCNHGKQALLFNQAAYSHSQQNLNKLHCINLIATCVEEEIKAPYPNFIA